MVFDARDKELAIGNHVRYVDTGTVGEIVDVKTEEGLDWVKIDKTELLEILNRASKEKEYTIREKVAQILILVDNETFNDLKTYLKNDENYYVRNVFKP